MMVRKILIGVLVVLMIAVTLFNPLMSAILALGVWIYLVVMYRRQKKRNINDQMDPGIAEWHSRRLKAFLIVAGFSFLAFVAGAILHNVLHGMSETEETAFLIIALVASFVFVAATAGGVAMFLKGRQKATEKTSGNT